MDKESFKQSYFFFNHDSVRLVGSYFKIGVPNCILNCSRLWLMEIICIMSAYISVPVNASFTIVQNVIFISWRIPIVYQIGTSLLLGKAIGQKDVGLIKQVVRVHTIHFLIMTVFISLILLFFKEIIFNFYTDHAELKSILNSLWLSVQLVQVLQCLITSFNGIFRGFGIQYQAMIPTLVILYLIGLPLSYSLCFLLGL